MQLEPTEAIRTERSGFVKDEQTAGQIGAEMIEMRRYWIDTATEVHVVWQPEYFVAELFWQRIGNYLSSDPVWSLERHDDDLRDWPMTNDTAYHTTNYTFPIVCVDVAISVETDCRVRFYLVPPFRRYCCYRRCCFAPATVPPAVATRTVAEAHRVSCCHHLQTLPE